MSQVPYPPSRPQKYRPRARWFVVGGALVVLAVVVFVVGLFLVLRPLAQEDAIVRAGEGPTTVELPAGEERALFTSDGLTSSCTVEDKDGELLQQRAVSGDFTYNEWTAQSRFDTGAGDVVVDCTASDSDVRVGQIPSTGAFVGGLLVTILGPIALGFAGLVVLLVTGILYGTRPARPRPE